MTGFATSVSIPDTPAGGVNQSTTQPITNN